MKKMLIKLENIEYKYMPGTPYEQTALKNINLEIKSGEFLGLIGHTGSGKSTLIQQLNGLLKPTAGSIYVDGKNIADKDLTLRELRFKVGLVFQYPEYQLFDETVEKDISFGPRNMGLSETEIEERVKEAMKLVGLSEKLKDKSPFELSGGQKRRTAIAGVLAMNPEVLILDEPAAGLDPKGRNDILSQIEYMHKKRDMTIILVSHSMEDIAKYADRVVVMKDGGIAAQGSADEIFAMRERLADINLDVPQITKVADILRKKGCGLPENIYTVDSAVNEIMKLFEKRNGS